MRIEVKGLVAGLAAGLFVLLAVYGVSKVVGPRDSDDASAPQMTTAVKSLSHKNAKMNSQMGTIALAQLVTTGRGIFTQNCASCHGATGQGAFGPNLYNSDQSDVNLANIVTNGIKPRMPGFAPQIQGPQMKALIAYIRSLKK